MARVVVIFAILAAITGAMFWLARHPSVGTHTVTAAITLPVAPNEGPNADGAGASISTHSDVAPSPSEPPPAGADMLPPSEAGSTGFTLNPSDAESKLLQQSTTRSAPSATAQTGLVVESVEAAGDDSIALNGRADPGATVKVSVNGKPAGEVVVGGGGAWSLSVDRGKGEAKPKIALELVGADGKLLDKTNFVFKPVVAPPLSPRDQSLITTRTTVAKPVTHKRPTTFRVRRGESLWRIARRKLGSGHKWREIYEANRDRIGDDPDYVRPGTRLTIPG